MMRIQRSKFGVTAVGQTVDRFTLSNSLGMSVDLLSYGGRVSAVRLPDGSGGSVNVVLGFEDVQSYEQDRAYLGALVGRYANRIAGASFDIDGSHYRLSANEGDNQLHGGFQGLHNRVLSATPFESSEEVGVELSTRLEDGLEGYPGNLDVRVRISLTEGCELKFDYRAMTDQPTHVNLTHHGYFNLAGSGSCMSHQLSINAQRYTPVDRYAIPTGELRDVSQSAFDFRKLKPLDAESGVPAGEPAGFDHNFALNKAVGELVEIAHLQEPVSGRSMRVSTTEPGVQLYTAQYLQSESVDGRCRYGPYAGVCLETQHFANSPNESNFPSTLLEVGEEYQQLTIYRFSGIS